MRKPETSLEGWMERREWEFRGKDGGRKVELV